MIHLNNIIIPMPMPALNLVMVIGNWSTIFIIINKNLETKDLIISYL